MEEEMEEENDDDDDDAEVINPYEEADPLNLPPPDSDTESEDMEVAPTPDDHEQEAEANTVGTITRVYILSATHSRWHLHPFRHYRERPYVAPTAPVALVDRADPDDPSLRPTHRPRHDDPYVMVRDAAARDEGDDAATTSDPQPSKPPGSPHCHLIMPPRMMTQAAIEKLVSDRVAAALAQDRATRENTNGAGEPGGNIGGNAQGQGGAPPARGCTYSSFMKCNPTSFHGNEGAVELSRWFEKTESVFSISECAERNKVKFAAATLQGRALTWWNSQVATLGLEVVNAKSWNDMKIMMREEFCPPEEIQRMEVELWNLRVKDSNIAAYTQRFNELILLCPEMVPSEKKKVEAYAPKTERIAKSNKRKWESNNNQGGKNNNQGGNNNYNRRNYQNNNRHNQNNNQRHGNARALTTTQNAGANQTGVVPKCNRYGICHFDQCPPKCNNCRKMGHKEKDCRSRNVASGTNARSAVVCYECGERGHKSNACPKRADRQRVRSSVSDKSFVDVRLSHLLDIKPAKLNTSYEVELADGKVLGTFDVIIGMDWLVERDAVIVCGKKEVHVPYKNKTLVVKGDSGASRLKVISCIKARKYIERGSQLFLAQVTEKEPSKKQLQDVPVIRNFPEVFPDDLPGLPPPRQVEFRIELVPGAAPVARAPYRLAPSELKELSDQLKELLEKGFIRPSSSPWGAPVLFVKKKDGSFQKESNKKYLKKILELLKKEQLYAKFSKYDFWLESYEWGTEEDEAFETLKQKLCSAPILTLPKGTENFVVYCDASHKGYEAVLMQREKVIAYASRQLKKHEENYTTHDLELGAVVFVLRTLEALFCKVIAWKGVIRLWKRGKLSPRVHWAIQKSNKRIGTHGIQAELPDKLHGNFITHSITSRSAAGGPGLMESSSSSRGECREESLIVESVEGGAGKVRAGTSGVRGIHLVQKIPSKGITLIFSLSNKRQD
ncbi:putative reverse transcriptase domain-containing protein [Tanacetum coccineum]